MPSSRPAAPFLCDPGRSFTGFQKGHRPRRGIRMNATQKEKLTELQNRVEDLRGFL